jgi:hypothetical protein
MRIFNLKTAARALMFLKENGIDSYDELCEKSDAASIEFHRLSSRRKEIGDRQKEVAELEKQIGVYNKTRDVYKLYIKSGKDENFYEANRADIALHQAAKKHFDENGYGKDKKLPSINMLKQEWATLESERRALSPGYKTVKEKYLSICTAKANADVMLFGSRQPQKSHDRDAR